MKAMGRVSTSQMFCVLFLCRIISLFTFMLPSAAYLPSGDRIITAIPVMLIELIYCIILIFTLKMSGNSSIVTCAGKISPFASKLLAIIYTFAFIWFAGIGTARFELFISTVMFPNSELYFMIFLLLAAAFYASLKGLEAISRASGILFFILGISVLFIIISVTGEFRLVNLKPLFTEGITPVAGFAFYVSVRAAELLTLHINAPYIEGRTGAMAVKWTVIFSVVTTVILTVLSGVTGEYGNDQIFPLYTLTVIAKFGIFERLDDILTGVWVLCSFVQLSFLINTGMNALTQGFGRIKKIPVSLLLTAGIFCVYLFTSRTVAVFSEAVSSRAVEIIFVALIGVIPLTVTLINKRKGKRKKA